MSETYLITAKTVEEAIAIANREYADETHEVSYEILDMPKKGFLGLGAKDAKIKVTVTKSVSADLDSLVADLRSMKVLTGRGDDGGEKQRQEKSDKPKQDQPKPQKPQQNGQPKPQNGQNGQQQNAQKQPKQNGQNAQNGQKPAQQKPQQQNGQNGQNQPKQPKPQNPNPQPKDSKPKQVEKPLEKPVEKQPDEPVSEIASKLDAAIENATSVRVNTLPETGSFGKGDSRPNLKNSAGAGRHRRQQPKTTPAETVIDPSGVTVSAPMGLTDFVAEGGESGFGKSDGGSGAGAAGGRMNNDIRRGKKPQPKQPQNPNSQPKQPQNGAKQTSRVVITSQENVNPMTKYDVAESDEDYEKLDALSEEDVLLAKKKEDGSEAPAAEERRREAVTQAEMDYAVAFANTLMQNMGLEARAVPAECPEGEELDTTEEATVYPRINIVGDDTGILIGHHGETLDAIQYLVNLAALRQSKQKDGDYVKIVVDIENYREKREETLRTLARRMAAKAVKYKRNVFLEPMNAYERRIIHSELQSFENVSTHSVGTDRDRKIIITYEGPDKQPEQPRGNRSRRRNDGPAADRSADKPHTEAPSAEGDEAKEGRKRSRHRPRKVQKMPIEMLPDLLDGSVAAPVPASETPAAEVPASETAENE